MKIILGLAIICISFHSIVCPPVNPQPAEGGSKEDDQDTGLDYDRYLKEVVEALEEDPDFRKKLEESNATDIKSGKISVHLERVAHHIRERLDEIKRREIDRLRILAREKMKTMNGIQKIDERVLHHLDVKNPHSFEIKDLERLIVKATNDLDELDKKRREEFKEYEMEKEHERKETLNKMPEEEKKKAEVEYLGLQKKHKDHPKLHHPGSKQQLEEVWDKKDHLDPNEFQPRTFFKMHDINGDGFLDEEEIEALFQKELDQVYDPNSPEDDMNERYEEMNRMREHVMNELDKDKDKLVSQNEFMKYTASQDFDKDEPWETIDENKQYTDEEYKEYERMLMEEEMKRRQQGAFDSHAQPGLVMQPPHDQNVEHMQQFQQQVHPNPDAQAHLQQQAQMHQAQMAQQHQQQMAAQQQAHMAAQQQAQHAEMQQMHHGGQQQAQQVPVQQQQQAQQVPVQQQAVPVQGQQNFQPIVGQDKLAAVPVQNIQVQQPGQGQHPGQGQQPAH